MKEIKTKSKIKFAVRRIANKNPRNARSFYRFKQKLSRAVAGLLVFGLLASGLFIGEGRFLRSELVKNSEVFVCEATTILTSLEDLNSRLLNLNRNLPKLFENLSFCTDSSCAAEKKIYQTEAEIWQIKAELAELKKSEKLAQLNFKKQFADVEDGVLFCENAERCVVAEKNLLTAQICEQELQTTAQIFEDSEAAEKKYTLINSKGKAYPASTYIEKLMEDVFKNKARIANSEQAYVQCVAMDDASVCQEYVKNKKEAEEKTAAATDELIGLKFDLENVLTEINTDIVALEIGRKDSENLVAGEGQGWCEENLQDKKTVLAEKTSRASRSKNNYEAALKKLEQKKLELAKKIAAEIEAAKMHAAAEKAAEEKRSKAEIIFSIWSTIRNTF